MADKLNVKIELNGAGIRELLKSEEIVSELESVANGIAEEAGNCEVETGHNYPERARVSIRQNSTSRDMEENTLLKAVHFQ
ncbi:MAG: hypothetical protein PUE58_01920 [Lachnospiraceae bacterium]|nr:hypothetical protein [Lachnospiraceae bacterium]